MYCLHLADGLCLFSAGRLLACRGTVPVHGLGVGDPWTKEEGRAKLPGQQELSWALITSPERIDFSKVYRKEKGTAIQIVINRSRKNRKKGYNWVLDDRTTTELQISVAKRDRRKGPSSLYRLRCPGCVIFCQPGCSEAI